MAHFGILCPPGIGHLNTMIPLGQELKRRGHRVTFFGFVDIEHKIIRSGLGFWAIGKLEFPLGRTVELLATMGELSDYSAVKYTINLARENINVFFRDVPSALRKTSVEALIVDQAIPEGGTIAESQSLPFITVCSALLMNKENNVPPFFTSWNYDLKWWSLLRNKLGYSIFSYLLKPIVQAVNKYRYDCKLPIYSDYPNDFCSELAILCQQPAEFDFKRSNLPRCFHFTGPYHEPATRDPVYFPFEKLTGQPLIYASLGTVQNRLLWVFRAIAKACVGLDAQLVISLGGFNRSDLAQKLPGFPIVVEYAPQLELLQRASITITHAGMNTTLESLRYGVPMVAIPITNDQPGIAARIAWTGTGEVVSLSCLKVPYLGVLKLRYAIQQVLTKDSYKKKACRLQEAIRESGGVSRGADIVEQVVLTGMPVFSHSNEEN